MFMKNTYYTNSILFNKNTHVMTARPSYCTVKAKFCPMLVETPNTGGVIDPKTY
jgi:hypothetical protein